MGAALEKVLFVGGPLHGARLSIPPNLWRYAVPVPVELRVQHVGLVDPITGPDNGPLYALAAMPEPVYYERTRWPYRAGTWAADLNDEHQFVMLGPVTEDRPALHPSAVDGSEHPEYAHIADKMWHARAEALIPECVVPGCAEKGRSVFIAAERGRLAGRDWNRGDQIRICPQHAHDIYCAQGVYGIEHLAEWLRPDAKLDPLDAYDAALDLIYGSQIANARARMLRLKIPGWR